MPEREEAVRKIVAICDVCGAQKKETNHWWRVSLRDGAFVFEKAERVSDLAGATDVCGESCAVKLLQRFMQTGQIHFVDVKPAAA
jgi:hypothetical protein